MDLQGDQGGNLATTPTASATASSTNKFSISTLTCDAAQLRLMCEALDLPTGNFTVNKTRILEAIKEKKLTTADLRQMPAIKPGFMRKATTKRRLDCAKTGARSRLSNTQESEMQGVQSTAENFPALNPIQASLSLNATPTNAAPLPLSLVPESTSIQALVLAFNKFQLRQGKWQREMELAVGSIATGYNEIVSAVNTIGKYMQPLIAETRTVKDTIQAISEAMNNFMDDRDLIKTCLGDSEQATTDLTEEIMDINRRVTNMDSTLDDVRITLSTTIDHTKALESKTEWLDRGQRSHNIIVFGWDPLPRCSPLEDAKRYFARIGFNLAESFLAHRGPKMLKDRSFRPGILRITFNSIPTCHRALEAAKAHSSDRSIPYYAKADRTKEQELKKRAADEGVRILRARHPGRDLCERSGKIAEFVVSANDPARSIFNSFVPIPLADPELMAK